MKYPTACLLLGNGGKNLTAQLKAARITWVLKTLMISFGG